MTSSKETRAATLYLINSKLHRHCVVSSSHMHAAANMAGNGVDRHEAEYGLKDMPCARDQRKES